MVRTSRCSEADRKWLHQLQLDDVPVGVDDVRIRVSRRVLPTFDEATPSTFDLVDCTVEMTFIYESETKVVHSSCRARLFWHLIEGDRGRAVGWAQEDH